MFERTPYNLSNDTREGRNNVQNAIEAYKFFKDPQFIGIYDQHMVGDGGGFVNDLFDNDTSRATLGYNPLFGVRCHDHTRNPTLGNYLISGADQVPRGTSTILFAMSAKSVELGSDTGLVGRYVPFLVDFNNDRVYNVEGSNHYRS